MKNKFYVWDIIKDSTLDNYEKGEIGLTNSVSLREFKGLYNSIEDLATKIGLTPDLGAWMALEDGILICNTAEKGDGSEMSPNDFQEFKKGKINSYNCMYSFWIKFIEGIYTPSSKELADKFNIEEL